MEESNINLETEKQPDKVNQAPEFEQKIFLVHDQLTANQLRHFFETGWKKNPEHGFIRDMSGGFWAFLYKVNAEVYDLSDYIKPELPEVMGSHQMLVEHGETPPEGYYIWSKSHTYAKHSVYTKLIGGEQAEAVTVES
jgi:hypothetical protein